MLLGVPSKCHAVQSGAIHVFERDDDLLRYAKSFAQYSRRLLTERFKTRYSFYGLDKEPAGFVACRFLLGVFQAGSLPGESPPMCRMQFANNPKASVDLISTSCPRYELCSTSLTLSSRRELADVENPQSIKTPLKSIESYPTKKKKGRLLKRSTQPTPPQKTPYRSLKAGEAFTAAISMFQSRIASRENSAGNWERTGSRLDRYCTTPYYFPPGWVTSQKQEDGWGRRGTRTVRRS